MLKKLLTLADGRISKTKVTALVSAAFAVAIAFGLDLTHDQRSALELVLVSLIAIFLRDGLDTK